VRFFTSIGYCETTEEMVAGTEQIRKAEVHCLPKAANEVCTFTSFAICETAEEVAAGTGQIRMRKRRS